MFMFIDVYFYSVSSNIRKKFHNFIFSMFCFFCKKNELLHYKQFHCHTPASFDCNQGHICLILVFPPQIQSINGWNAELFISIIIFYNIVPGLLSYMYIS